MHCGTHIDAPSHFVKRAFDKGVGVEVLDLEVLNGDLALSFGNSLCMCHDQSSIYEQPICYMVMHAHITGSAHAYCM